MEYNTANQHEEIEYIPYTKEGNLYNLSLDIHQIKCLSLALEQQHRNKVANRNCYAKRLAQKGKTGTKIGTKIGKSYKIAITQ